MFGFAIDTGLAVAFASGVIIAVLSNNIPFGLVSGVAIGVALTLVLWRTSKREDTLSSKDG